MDWSTYHVTCRDSSSNSQSPPKGLVLDFPRRWAIREEETSRTDSAAVLAPDRRTRQSIEDRPYWLIADLLRSFQLRHTFSDPERQHNVKVVVDCARSGTDVDRRHLRG